MLVNCILALSPQPVIISKIRCVVFSSFTKHEFTYERTRVAFFHLIYLDSRLLENFKILFVNLNADQLDSACITAKRAFSQENFLNAIINKNPTGIPTFLIDFAISIEK